MCSSYASAAIRIGMSGMFILNSINMFSAVIEKERKKHEYATYREKAVFELLKTFFAGGMLMRSDIVAAYPEVALGAALQSKFPRAIADLRRNLKTSVLSKSELVVFLFPEFFLKSSSRVQRCEMGDYELLHKLPPYICIAKNDMCLFFAFQQCHCRSMDALLKPCSAWYALHVPDCGPHQKYAQMLQDCCKGSRLILQNEIGSSTYYLYARREGINHLLGGCQQGKWGVARSDIPSAGSSGKKQKIMASAGKENEQQNNSPVVTKPAPSSSYAKKAFAQSTPTRSLKQRRPLGQVKGPMEADSRLNSGE